MVAEEEVVVVVVVVVAVVVVVVAVAASASASSTTSLSISPEPGIDGPPVWIVLWMPCLRAQATMVRASSPAFTDPSPISPQGNAIYQRATSRVCATGSP